MGYRKHKEDSRPVKVLGLTLIRWLLLVISFFMSVAIGQVESEVVAALAEKLKPNDEILLRFMLVIAFLGTVAIIFAILDALIAKIRGKG